MILTVMIEIKNLQKVIGHLTVLDIPELIVPSGEITGIIGPVGSGGDVFLELLTGKTRPSMGSIRIADIDPAVDRKQFGVLVGVLFADDGLYERQSAQSNLSFYCQLYGLPNRRSEEILELIGLKDRADEIVSKLSSGLKRRLAFGRTILHKPRVLILVEPFQRCDETSIELLNHLIRQIADTGAVVLILVNDSGHLVNICDGIFKLERGQIVESIRPKESQIEVLPFKIPVRMEGKVLLVNPAEVLFADASDGKAILCTSEGRLATQFTLTELENRLIRSGFFRAHRSYLVNLQHVKEVIPYTRNSFSLRLDDVQETVIPLSKQAAGELKELLGY